MSNMFKNKCTEFSAYDILIPLEDLMGDTGTLPLSILIVLMADNAELTRWTIDPATENPLPFTIPGHYNQIIDRNLQSELRQIAIVAFYDLIVSKLYSKEFEYWVESAFISKEDSTLSNECVIDNMTCAVTTTTTGATQVIV